MPTTTTVASSPDETVAEITRQKLQLSLSTPLASEETPLVVSQSKSHKRFGLRSLFAQFFTSEFRVRLRRIAPWLISGGILGLNLVMHAPTFVLGACIAGLTVQIVKAIIKSNPLCQRIWQTLLEKAGIPEHKLPWMAVCFGSGAWLAAALPSHALFFQAAEEYVQTIFAGANTGGGAAGVDGLIPLLFGTLRVIFVLYIGIALVRVINAFRNDEDWQTAARIPLITVLCIVIGDALSTLIVT
ncbi:hypothetical protein JOY44_25570 (plasmid) [Phormidium sp. CLA17]|uniref:hypothetical protein n=1 Tax=Leptolyngbya sp. Cla-17 TaxID=2803751 RepID=UPI0014914D4C|nr:hypothetical protein [Leptolyngbya sp. Cla-17]MBM0744892.1 hypothetical protein [Leptolyngbya sp. Cla-17]